MERLAWTARARRLERWPHPNGPYQRPRGLGHAALSRGEHQAAVHAFTGALRACAAGGDGPEARGAMHKLYTGRAAAYAALGDQRRALADADEAHELA